VGPISLMSPVLGKHCLLTQPAVPRWGCPVPLGEDVSVGLECERSNIELGVPHQLIEEDTYRGYVVPERTTVIANSWYADRNSPHYGSKNLSALVPVLQGDDTQ
jgi:hypothetical protein